MIFLGPYIILAVVELVTLLYRLIFVIVLRGPQSHSRYLQLCTSCHFQEIGAVNISLFEYYHTRVLLAMR